MPRNVKESDDEFETRSGRRTRTALGSSLLDSPLRRSTRIKQPVLQNDSSPESHSDVSSIGSRSTRRRTTAIDGTIPETIRNLRGRRNSAASDISELAENDLSSETPNKRMTRRSIATLPSAETPSKLLAKARRGTRAGSETISTPPVGRVTRRTRASSMEPEASEEAKHQDIGTPSKTKRRASALPSEPAVAEESEEIRIEQTVFEIDEDESESSLNVSKSRRKSKIDTSDEKMEVDETPESEVETIEGSFREKSSSSSPNVPKTLEDSTNVLDSNKNNESRENSFKHQNTSGPVKGLSRIFENSSNTSAGVQKDICVSEDDEISNKSIESSSKNISPSKPEAKSSPRIALNPLTWKVAEKRFSVSHEAESSSVHEETKMTTNIQQQNVANDISIADKIFAKKDYPTECIVVIEPMNVEMTNRKFDFSKNQAGDKQQRSNDEEETNLKIAEEDEEHEETTNDPGLGIESVTSAASKDSEDANDKEESDKITEIDDSLEDRGKSLENMITDETSSSDQSIVEISRQESETDGEKLHKSNNEETIVGDATPKPNTLGSSTTGKTPKKSEKGEETLCVTEKPMRREIIAETSTDGETSPMSEKEILSRATSIPGLKICRRVSLETPNKSEEKEEKSICEMAKDRKSSIVTESSSGETNKEESLEFGERDVTKESSGNEITSTERKQEDSVERKRKSDENDEFRVSESDNESENIGCPTFKDIPADEWNDRDENEETTGGKTDRDSIHSFSTERNESECDIALIDKELSQPRGEADGEAKTNKNANYDSDDTVVEGIEKIIKDPKNDEQKMDEGTTNENTAMDVSVGNVDEDTKKTNLSPTKRSSLTNSTKFGNENHEESSDKTNIPTRSSTSRRKSLPNLDNESNKSASNSEDASRKSLNVSRKKRSANSFSQEFIDAHAMENDVEETKNSLKVGESPRTSLNASVGRSSTASTLVTSVTKKRRSLNKSCLDSPDTKIQRKPSADRTETTDEENSGNEADSQEHREEGTGESKRKSVNDRSRSKIEEEKSNSEMEEEDFQQKLNGSSRSNRKSGSSGGTLRIERSSVDSETEDDENLAVKLNESSRSTSGRKSFGNKNTSMRKRESSSSEEDAKKSDGGEHENSVEMLNRSKKSSSSRRSMSDRNRSKIEEEKSNSEMEEEDFHQKLNGSSRSNRKSGSSGGTLRIERSSVDSETEDDENLAVKLNESSRSTSGRKSFGNKNTSMRKRESSSSEEDAKKSDGGEHENSVEMLNRSKKSSSSRRSMFDRSRSKIEDESAASESEQDDESGKNMNTSVSSNRKSLNSGNASIERSASESETEEDENSVEQLSSKSTSGRRSLSNKNKSITERDESSSEMGEGAQKSSEDSPETLNRSKKSSSDRRSLNDKNKSKIEKEDSDSEIEASALRSSLDRSKKSARKSLGGKNNSRVEQNHSVSELNDPTRAATGDSDSNVDDNDESRSSENGDESHVKIPRFFYDVDTSSDGNDDSDKSIDSEVANDLNLAGKSIIEYSDDDVPGDDCVATESESYDSEDDDGEDLEDFVVNDDECDSSEVTEADEEEESSKKASRGKEKRRKRIIPRSARDSDSADSDEETKENSIPDEDSLKAEKTLKKDKNGSKDESLMIVSPDETQAGLTPMSDEQRSDSPMELEKVVVENASSKGVSKKTKDTLLESSTPNVDPRGKVSAEKSNSAKSKKSSKIDNPTAKLDSSIPESLDTPTKLSTSLKAGGSAKTPKTPKSAKIDSTACDSPMSQTVHTPVKLTASFKNGKSSATPKTPMCQMPVEDSNDSEIVTILPKAKLDKKSKLNRTMTTPNTDSPDTRFLMKERLNDTLPALKLQPRTKQLRRSVLDNVREEASVETDETPEGNVETTEEISVSEVVCEMDVDKSKKKKKKKKSASDKNTIDGSDATENESVSIVDACPESSSTDGAPKKSKRKRNKQNLEPIEVEESTVNETETAPTKKTKRKNKKPKLREEAVENTEIIDIEEKGKKKKDAGSNLEEETAGDQEILKEKKKKRKKKVHVVESERTPSEENLSILPKEIETLNADGESTSSSRKCETKSTLVKKGKLGREECKMREKSVSFEQAKIVKTSPVKSGNAEKKSFSVKRLPDDLLESLAEVSERPRKRRKTAREEKVLPSRSMFNVDGKACKNIQVNNDFISLSSSGGTTQFGVVDLEKVRKKTKKSVAAKSFRERMLARNPRQPISAYLMYQQKQKVSGKNQLY